MQGYLPLLTATHAVDRGAHIIVNFAPRNAARDTESVPMGVEQQPMGLQQIGPNQEALSVRQLDVGSLQLRALNVQKGKSLTIVSDVSAHGSK